MDIESKSAAEPLDEEPEQEEVAGEETGKSAGDEVTLKEASAEKQQIGSITARSVTVSESAVGAIKGDSVKVNLENGVIGAVVAEKVKAEVNNGAIGAVLAQSATLKQSQVGILVAGQIRGDARILFDMRAGFVAGLTAGLVLAAFKLIAGRRVR